MIKNNFSMDENLVNYLMFASDRDLKFGLLDGKLGVAICMYHYGEKVNNDIYCDYANILIDNISERIHKNLPLSFESGLCGIAWGIEYLIHHKFVDGNSNEICEDMDQCIISMDAKRIKDLSLGNGLEGLLHYILARINGTQKQHIAFPFDDIYIKDILYVIEQIDPENISHELNGLINDFKIFVQKGKTALYNYNILNFIDENINIAGIEITKIPIGIKNGMAGYLLRKILS
jgi:hypothetical protein